MPGPRSTRSSVHSAIAAAGSPTATTSTTGVSSTPPPASANASMMPSSSISSSRSIRTVDDLIAERLAQPLPSFSATNSTEFMKWAYQFINHFRLIPGFTREMLERPRDEISFGTVPDAQVTLLYLVLWERLFLIASQLTGILSTLEEIPMGELHSLWTVLKNEFCPHTNVELAAKSRRFLEMRQGDGTVTSFTKAVLAEKDLLHFLGVLKTDDDVRNTIIAGLSSEEAQSFAFRFVDLPLSRFVAEVNRYDTLTAYHNTLRSGSTGAVRSSSSLSSSHDTALLTDVNTNHLRNVQCYHCDGWGHYRSQCPDGLIPKEELQRRKQSRVEESTSTANADHGRSSGGSGRGRRQWRGRGRGRARHRNRGGGNSSRYSPSTTQASEGRVAVAIVDGYDRDEDSAQLTDFDWSSIEDFHPMDNTFALGPLIEEESIAPAQSPAPMEEEHIVLSAISDVDDIDLEEEAVIHFAPVATPFLAPIPVFINVVNVEPQVVPQGLPAAAPEIVILEDVPDDVVSIRDNSSDEMSVESMAAGMEVEEIRVPTPPPVDDGAVQQLQPPEVVGVIPRRDASPVSVLSEDDVSLSEHRIMNVISDTLRWDNVQPRNFMTRAESRATRHYIRVLRAQIKTLRERLHTRISQLRRFHPDIFDLNFDFGVQPGDMEVAAPPTDKHSVGYYHYWRYYYQCRVDLVFNRNSRILRPLQGRISQRHTQWDVAPNNRFDARYQLFHPAKVHGHGWPAWRQRQIERYGPIFSLSSMYPNMAEANEWTGSQRPSLWSKDRVGVHSAPGRLPYYRPLPGFRRGRWAHRCRQWGRILPTITIHRQRWERRQLQFVKEVGDGTGRIFPTNGIHPQWDYLFPVWESNPAHMLQCMMMVIEGYQIQFDYREMLGNRMCALYDRNLDIYLRRKLWFDYDYNPYEDRLLSRIFNPIDVGSVMELPGLDWRYLEPHLTDTAEIESPEQLDMSGSRSDTRYSLDRTTFHLLQHRCLARGASVDLGVLQVVDYVNGYGYTYFYQARASVIWEASRMLMVTPYRVLTYCVQVLRATNMQIAELCASAEMIVRSVRFVISYFTLSIVTGSDFLLILLTLLHISVYITIEQTIRYLHNKRDSEIVVLGENYYALMVAPMFQESNDPVFDSGATSHVWNHLGHFTSFRQSDGSGFTIRLANGTKVLSAGIGDIGPLRRVLYVPEMAHCLISARVLAADGYEMTTGKGARVTRIGDPTMVLLQSDSVSGLYQISQRDFETQLGLCHTVCLVHTLNEDNAMKLHYMLGHASVERCIHTCKCTQFPGLKSPPPKAFKCVRECPDCALAKAHRRSFKGSLDIPEFVGQVWQVDVKGPIQCESLVNGNKYVFGLIDVKTKFMVQYFIKTKDEVFKCFKVFYQEYLLYVKSRPQNVNMGVITIISDRGEFNSNAIASFCLDKGLSPVTTCAYTPEQNGLIERTWRSLSEAAIAMLITANLSEPYWELARECAGFIRNRIVGGNPSDTALSPFEKFYGIKPHVKDFKIFGVWAYVLIPVKEKNHSPKAEQGIFVGYSERKIGGYKIYLPRTSEIVESAHVRFGTSPNRSLYALEPSARVEVSSLGRELLNVSSSVPETASEQRDSSTNPNIILSDYIPQVRPQIPSSNRSVRGGRTKSRELITEPSVTTEVHEVPSPASVIAPVNVQETDMLMRSMSDLVVTDTCSGGTDHPDPILSQPHVEGPSVPMCTPPVVNRSGMTARERID